jgi:SAM-dependent methyltransferase
MTEIVDTGERILLEKETPLMIARHFCAYKFAKAFIRQRDVLDIGCGEGYGADFLADSAKTVLGIDYDEAVIDYAKNKYRKENLKFAVMDIKDLNSLNQKFDVICSFQNIEHIRGVGKLLSDINNLLRNNGIFICSTCNKKDASPGRDAPFNKYHVREYLADEFGELLEGYFHKVEIFGLKRGPILRFYRRLKKIGLFNFLPPELDPVKKFYQNINCGNFIWVNKDIDNCLDFIAICYK